MKFKKLKYLLKTLFILFNFFIILTLFLPCVSIDKYVEYEFLDGYYTDAYKSHTIPKATKIKPIDIIKSLSADRRDLTLARANYTKVKQSLVNMLEVGAISEEEYFEVLSKESATNEYVFLSISFGDDDELSRLQSKSFLYAVILLIFYVVALLSLVFNLINLFLNKRFFCVANIFFGWALAVLLLIFNIYTFAMAISSETQITGFSGKIIQESTVCLSPKFILLLTMFLLVGYNILAMWLDKKEQLQEKQNREIPLAVSGNISHKNKFRKIHSKKSKYKNGSKKKRNR